MSVVHLTDESFKKEVLESDVPVLVDFWAPWCGPCRIVAPLVDEIAKEYRDRLKVCKVNVDDSSRTASHYGVMSIPTLVFFHKGKVMEQIVGALNKPQLKKKVEENI